MTYAEIIKDLNTIRSYFEEESGGCVPVCLDEAIGIITALDAQQKGGDIDA